MRRLLPCNQKQYWRERIILAYISIILQVITIYLVLWKR